MATAVCPNGHTSEATDYCDQCGAKIDGDPGPKTLTGIVPAPQPVGSTPAPTKPCPSCGVPNAEDDRYCEACGYDMDLGVPSAPTATAPAAGEAAAAWQLAVTADRDYYDRIQAGDIAFPAVYPDRIFQLDGPRATIGRRSASRGINPEIDLSGAPEDPGVSHLHAVIVGSSEAGWKIVDPGSSNGTYLNDSVDPIPNNVEVALSDGDRIHIGAWTMVVLQKV